MISIGTRLASKKTDRYEDGTYELKERLGGGRIAQVFLAEQTWPTEKQGHQAAIKLAANPGNNDRLESERQVLEAVAGKPGFPQLEGYGITREEDGRVFLVMELIPSPKDSGLAQRARGRPGHRLDERLGVEAAAQYAQMLKALHATDRISTDRKLDDIVWDDKTNPDKPRLVVLDWNVTAVDREAGRQHDLYEFGLFWHELLLGTPPVLGPDRAVVRLEDHPYWPNLTYGTQRILARALHRVAAQRYQKAEELLADLEALAPLFRLGSAEELVARAKETSDPVSILTVLDVIRVYFPDAWPNAQDEAKQTRQELQKGHQKLLAQALSEIRQALYSQALTRLERVRKEGAEDLEQALRVERWLRLARFGSGLEAEVARVFQEQALPVVGGEENVPGIIEDLENGRFSQAVSRFWDLLTGTFLDPSKRSRVPTDFLKRLEEAQKQHREGHDPRPWLREACTFLHEPWPLQEALFCAVVGLATEEQEALFFLADEGLMRERLEEAHREGRTGDLYRAADLYGQAQRLFEAIPYADLLLQVGLEKPSESLQMCERLAETLGKAEKCLKDGQVLLETRPPEFKRALAEFERGLALFPDNVPSPEWARLRGEGKVTGLWAGRMQAQRCLALQDVLETNYLDFDLEAALMRCETLLDEFPENLWGQEQRERLRRRLVGRVEKALSVRPLLADQPLPETRDALLAARLVALARYHFHDDTEIQQRLPGWELRATLALQAELDAQIAHAEEKLRQGWQGGLDQVLDDWMAGHARLQQAVSFPDVFEREALAAQEGKLDALYDQVKYLAQLQRDVATQIGKRRVAIDELEQQRRETRRQAEELWQEARGLYEKAERPDRRQAALEQARRALELWPERQEVCGFVEKVEREITDVDGRLKEALCNARAALAAGNYEEALHRLEEAPPDVDLLPAQREARNQLRNSIEELQCLNEELAEIMQQEHIRLSAPLGWTPPDIWRAQEHLGQIAKLVEGTPGELPDSLKRTLDGYLQRAESLLWRARGQLRFWEVNLLCQFAGSLAMVGMLRQQVKARATLSEVAAEAKEVAL